MVVYAKEVEFAQTLYTSTLNYFNTNYLKMTNTTSNINGKNATYTHAHVLFTYETKYGAFIYLLNANTNM